MQIERKISSLLEYFAEMQLIYYKDNANREQYKIKGNKTFIFYSER